MSCNKQPGYDTLELLEAQWQEVSHHTDFSLAFLHGTISADCYHQQQRVLSLFEAPPEHVREFLKVWQNHIEKSLQSDDYEFHLPDDEDIARKSQLIKDWASGFVYGMDELANVLDPLNIEFCEDIRHIANLTPISETEQASEDSERDLAEIEEYCRMGAISMFTEMRNS